MNRYLSRLNPMERRFVIGVGLLLFIVINIFWVRPHFSDWGNLKGRLDAAKVKRANNQAAIQQIPALDAEVRKFSGEGEVPPEDQAINFQQTIQAQAFQSGVTFAFPTRPNTSTNQFLIEQSQVVSITGGEKQLVDFLYNLGSGNSLVRARGLAVRPEPNHFQLNANITLIASYQKKPKAPPARTTPATSSAAAKPAAAPKSTTTVPQLRTTNKTNSPAAKPVGPKALIPPPKK